MKMCPKDVKLAKVGSKVSIYHINNPKNLPNEVSHTGTSKEREIMFADEDYLSVKFKLSSADLVFLLNVSK